MMLQEISEVLSDPTTSNWLRKSLDDSLSRDPIDAAFDAELLVRLLNKRADEALSESMTVLYEEYELEECDV
jgi:hypothetical protein